MDKKPNGVTRRTFLGGLMLLPPALGLVGVSKNLLGGLAAGETPTPTATTAALSCVGTPSTTEGPYFVDEMLKRIDIRTDPTDNTVKQGLPLYLAIRVFQVNGTACIPIKDAQVDIWHCDASGAYSDIANGAGQANTAGKKFLRGYQITDETGLVNFLTIYPGWYQGRTVHIHIKIRVPNGTSTYELTSQFFFDDKLSDEIYKAAPYNQHTGRNVTNANDSILTGALTDAHLDADDFGENVLLKLTKNTDKEGYSASANIGLDLTKPVPTSSAGNGGPGGGMPPPRR
jgi:protocatechuate 3,4-dioxygenase beta subunit